jgi:serine protease SohB
VLGVHDARRRKVMDRFTQSAGSVAERLLLKLWQRGEKPLL